MLERQLRLWSGLVIAAFVIPHLINHVFGIASIEAMEGARPHINAFWKTPVGGFLLYGSFLIHFVLGLIALCQRSHLRMARWEAIQLILGLLVWPLLMLHVIGTRFSHQALEIEVTYAYVVLAIWSYGPWMIAKQSALLLVVWGHLAAGLHFWLRLKPWYPKAVPILYPLAVLLPLLALLGFWRAGLEAQALAADPAYAQAVFAEYLASPEHLRAILLNLEPILLAMMIALVTLTLIARVVRHYYRNARGTYALSLPDGRMLRGPVGQTILETLKSGGVEHASVCGGRGRCTTCRVSVGEAAGHLPLPNETEQKALARIDASPDIRLACQTRPRHDLRITPLLPPDASAVHGRLPGGVHGREQEVAVMFADLRGSTRLGEQRMPYDVLFVLNLFFAEMTAALRETGGHYAQFNGDGLMALYGLESGIETGSHQAFAGAARMLARLEALNRGLRGELTEPLRMGIGIHAGEAIVGTMGPPHSPLLSAIGDNINIAARLEGQTKEFGCTVVASEAVAEWAALDGDGLDRHHVTVKGRAAPIPVLAIPDAESLAALIEEKRPGAPPTRPKSAQSPSAPCGPAAP
ncbi:MAG: adenylate/guanylate cyclase domain-containing protein [Rhodospirillales bacterium]|nr:adenylate/guanylate cyclase domain-containing protein [Rhodospirillales bacterium]